MPCRNVVKKYYSDSYYHVYNRGVEKRKIFIEEQDYAVFLSIISRYLNQKSSPGSQGREYLWLADEIELIAYCLMPNHFHLVLYQIDDEAITRLLRAVSSSYANYFNAKYQRVGALFQGKFKAVLINSDEQLDWLIRYVHRNPRHYLNYRWSSLDYWLGRKRAAWIKPDKRVNQIDTKSYLDYLCDDEDYVESLQYVSKIS